MRKICIFIVSAALVSFNVLAQTNEVTSINIVGFNRMSIPTNSYAQVAVQFDSIETNEANLMGVFGTNALRAEASSADADNIYLWNPTKQKYEMYALKSTDMKYHYLTNWGPLGVANPSLQPGQAFWVKTPATGPYAETPLAFAIVGEVVSVMTKTTDVVNGFQMLGYPFSCDIEVNNMTFTNATKHANWGNADHIVVWNGTMYDSYGLKDDGQWYSAADWIAGPAATNVFRLGQGFWYDARNTFTWGETNLYIDKL